jgi:hypothetical protein
VRAFDAGAPAVGGVEKGAGHVFEDGQELRRPRRHRRRCRRRQLESPGAAGSDPRQRALEPAEQQAGFVEPRVDPAPLRGIPAHSGSEPGHREAVAFGRQPDRCAVDSGQGDDEQQAGDQLGRGRVRCEVCAQQADAHVGPRLRAECEGLGECGSQHDADDAARRGPVGTGDEQVDVVGQGDAVGAERRSVAGHGGGAYRRCGRRLLPDLEN